MIDIVEVAKAFDIDDGSTLVAVDGLSLTVGEGEFVSVIGPSGCGKSTVLEMIAGLIRPTSGRIDINGHPVAGPNTDVGMVFQEDATFPWMTNRRNVEFGLRNTSLSRSAKRERVAEVLDLVGLGGFEDRYPQQLSGGMRQRVNLARVLAARPRIILLDEPFGALDEQTRLTLGDELMRILAEATGTTFVLVTHSLSEAAMLSDRIVVLTQRPGAVREVVTSPISRPRSSAVLQSPHFASVVSKLWSLLSDAPALPEQVRA